MNEYWVILILQVLNNVFFKSHKVNFAGVGGSHFSIYVRSGEAWGPVPENGTVSSLEENP